jgi:hypothetical protein
MPGWAMFLFAAVVGWVTLSVFVGMSLGRWLRRLSDDPVAATTLRYPDQRRTLDDRAHIAGAWREHAL